MTSPAALVCLGLLAGIVSGIVGIGGGVLIIPALIFFFGLSQHLAQGTTLALLVPPIGLLAAWTYYRAGFVNLEMAAWICVGFFFGGLLGARIAIHLPALLLERIFGVALLIIAVKMIIAR
jgi:uncharacterized protein